MNGFVLKNNKNIAALEAQFFQNLLGLREDFFITWDWNIKGLENKTAIKQNLKDNFDQINFEENPKTCMVLESIGFNCNMAAILGKKFPREIQDPNLLWQKIQSFIQVRLGALVDTNPKWTKSEQTFEVYNSTEKKKKQYQSILITSPEGLNGSNESLMMLTETALGDPSTTETWYHATTFRDAEQIMKNGFRFRSCMKNRNFSDQDGIYFTDSIKSAKQLFHHNSIIDPVVYPDIEYKKKETAAERTQLKIVVLAFTYHKEENNLLEKYKKHSIDLRDHASEQRLKKIVHFFSKDPLTTYCPTIEEHGLDSDYEDDIEYIIGPHAQIMCFSNDPLGNIYVNRSLTQLCVRCVGRKSMKKDFESLIQKEVYILDLDGNDICKLCCLIYSGSRLM
jgi:hypothetical protein